MIRSSFHPGRTSYNLVILLVLLLLVASCGPLPIINQLQRATLTQNSPSTISTTADAFTLGVEYAILGVAQDYAAADVRYAKLQDVFAIWANIEPVRGKYLWGPLDALVWEYQRAGFSGIQMDISAESPWAATKAPSLGNKGDPFPKEAYLSDYTAFVSALVERYDDDGVDDMPGLVYPIHDYGIEREFTGFWPGTTDEYARLLHLAYPAVKAADPQSRVLLVALLMTDVFDGNPSQAEIAHRLTLNADYMRKQVPEIRAILAACDAYDIACCIT